MYLAMAYWLFTEDPWAFVGEAAVQFEPHPGCTPPLTYSAMCPCASWRGESKLVRVPGCGALGFWVLGRIGHGPSALCGLTAQLPKLQTGGLLVRLKALHGTLREWRRSEHRIDG